MVANVMPKDAWAALVADPGARLVDVRTDAEWRLVGVPDLDTAGKRAVLICWQFPTGQVNAGFTDELRAAGLEPQHTLFFLCRSGVRSLAAAHAAAAAGFPACFNVAHGFEGHPDAAGGWKADGLPWRR